MNTWPDIDKGLICGDCYALILISKYQNCRRYCESLDLECSSAFDEVDPDTCTIETSHNCDTDFAWTSDALCQCSIGIGMRLRAAAAFVVVMAVVAINIIVHGQCLASL